MAEPTVVGNTTAEDLRLVIRASQDLLESGDDTGCEDSVVVSLGEFKQLQHEVARICGIQFGPSFDDDEPDAEDEDEHPADG